MRKFDISEYEVTMENGQAIPYRVKDSAVTILFNPDRKLNAVELMKANKLAERIMAAKDSILLEEADYGELKKACETVRGYGKEDVEFVRRIIEAPEINVVEGK
jgi:predicted glycosyltransferase involved in capsule biosynthesis